MIPFNRPFLTGNELRYIEEAHARGHLAGDGQFTRRCHEWLRAETGAAGALLTHSCTAALEMTALLADIAPGDEVIMPSYTFVSTANAFCLRGGVPVFVDIRADTLNIDETLIESAITERTRAICVVHYAGVGCEMDAIMEIAQRRGLMVIEDAAQAVRSRYAGRPLGSFGALAAFSFHETKNIISGEGGALLVNDPGYIERAEIIREKGTDRSRFFRGQIDKYTWCDVGSSFLPGEITAAFLCAQMEQADTITERRLRIWDRYRRDLADLERRECVRLPVIPPRCTHNGHMFYVLLRDLAERGRFIEHLKQRSIHGVFHYVPLHSSPAGIRLGRAQGPLPRTVDLSERIVRLPLWLGLEARQDEVIAAAHEFFS
jgi:dTDP-4-amino-4,6-dideoxygalactose transaminase